MIDEEVESILLQIRDGVRAKEERTHALTAQAGDEHPAPTGPADGEPTPVRRSGQNYPNLATMNRAWDRLPPVISNRHGAFASVELWLKQILKRGTRWFTWEQVNFNAAVHHTFREVIEMLEKNEQHLMSLSTNLISLSTKLSDLDRSLAELRARQTNLEQAFEPRKSEILQLSKATVELSKALQMLKEEALVRDKELRAEVTNLDGRVASLDGRLDVREHTTGDERKELRARINESLLEIREATERVRDEQRVCFKQLTLEVSETKSHEERELRALQQRIVKLESARESSSKATNGGDS